MQVVQDGHMTKKVCEKIIRKIVEGCYGVVGMATPSGVTFTSTIFSGIFNNKGVEVLKTENGLLINVFIVAEYGTNFKTISKNLCDLIKYNLDKYYNLKICSINIHVKGVRLSDK